MTQYGFIGLGHLGEKIVGCLLRGGLAVKVFDLDSKAVERVVASGASAGASAGDVARASDVVITCLPSPTISEKVLQQMLSVWQKNATWIEMSTLDRDNMIRLSTLAAAKGIKTLECPVTGGVHLAAVGKITMLVGGDRELFQQHEKALRLIASRVFFMGAIGSAALIKVITNMLAFINLVGSSEALMLAKKGGLDLATAFEAIKASSGNSFVHETEGALILSGSYEIDFTMDLVLKDLGFALGFGKEFDVPLSLAAAILPMFQAGKEKYGGTAQSPKVAKLLEEKMGTDLRATGYPKKLKA
ncbi:MAG: NAD(P)-dependent oxidoreductase, partial [Alphaproteobacteria bacterium]